MADDHNNHWWETVKPYTDGAILGILLIVEAFVFIRLKFKIDFTGILTLLMQLAVAILRVITNRFAASESPVGVTLNISGQQLIWISLYYFTFELKIIENALIS
jgi:hypothetical protein